jgi:predicted DNA-binding protein (MmcQ/YjbR family)
MAKGDAHALFAGVIEHCRTKAGAAEARLLGETVFRVHGRVFAFVEGSRRATVTVKSRPEDAERMLRDPHVRRARYIGRFGWLTVTVRDDDSLRLALALIDASYLLVAARPGRRGESD